MGVESEGTSEVVLYRQGRAYSPATSAGWSVNIKQKVSIEFVGQENSSNTVFNIITETSLVQARCSGSKMESRH